MRVLLLCLGFSHENPPLVGQWGQMYALENWLVAFCYWFTKANVLNWVLPFSWQDCKCDCFPYELRKINTTNPLYEPWNIPSQESMLHGSMGAMGTMEARDRRYYYCWINSAWITFKIPLVEIFQGFTE